MHRMQTAIVASIAACLLAASPQLRATPAGDGLVGIWALDKRDQARLQVRIHRERDGRYWGTVVNSDGKRAKNGHRILRALSYDAKDGSYKGILVPPGGDIEVTVTVSLSGADKMTVVGRKLFMKKEFRFVRVR